MSNRRVSDSVIITLHINNYQTTLIMGILLRGRRTNWTTKLNTAFFILLNSLQSQCIPFKYMRWNYYSQDENIMHKKGGCYSSCSKSLPLQTICIIYITMKSMNISLSKRSNASAVMITLFTCIILLRSK